MIMAKEHLRFGSICDIMMYDILCDVHNTDSVSQHSRNRNYLSFSVNVACSGHEFDSVFILRESEKPPYVWQPPKQSMRFSFLYENSFDKLVDDVMSLCRLASGNDNDSVSWSPASVYDVWAIATFSLASAAEKVMDGYIGDLMHRSGKALDEIFSDLVLESSVSSVLASRLSFHVVSGVSQMRPTQTQPVRVYCWNDGCRVILIPIGFEGKKKKISNDCLDRIGSILSPVVRSGSGTNASQRYDTSVYHKISDWICQNLLEPILSTNVIIKYDDYIGGERCYLCESDVKSSKRRGAIR